MIAKNEKMTPEISCSFTHFLEIQPSLFRNIGDGTKPLECIGNPLLHCLIFGFWNSFIRYFNPGIFFVVFSLHISRGEINISLDSNCTDIVTKFRQIKVVLFLTAIWFWLFNFWLFSRGRPH